MNNVVQSLWIGNRLSTMERLSISSFLAHGHSYHLFAYQDIDGVPTGATVKDASEVLPQSMVFEYREHKSYSGFSNFFRYKLLLERGGWWVDTDVICIRPFMFTTEYVFATERDVRGREFVTSGIIRAPTGSELMNRAWLACQLKNPPDLRWGETGPNLMHGLVFRTSYCQFVQSADIFCPIDPMRWMNAILPGRTMELGSHVRAVHLWNEFWRRNGIDKDETFAPGCLYEQLKALYLG